MTAHDPMITILEQFADSGVPLTLRLKGDFAATGSPMGPGKITRARLGDKYSPHQEGMFVFDMPVMVGSPGKTGQETVMPITVRASDILWISIGVQTPEESKILAPPGARNPGGIYT